MMSDAILVAVIGAPHGIRGELRLKSFTEKPMTVASYGALQLEDGSRDFRITSARPLKDDMLVVRLAGVDSRDDAERLTNLRLFVSREQLPAPGDEEFYHADLVGLSAEDSRGSPLGQVIAMHNYGAGDLVEIAPPRGETLLVPFTKAFVPVVDLANRRVVIADEALDRPDDPAGPAEPQD